MSDSAGPSHEGDCSRARSIFEGRHHHDRNSFFHKLCRDTPRRRTRRVRERVLHPLRPRQRRPLLPARTDGPVGRGMAREQDEYTVGGPTKKARNVFGLGLTAPTPGRTLRHLHQNRLSTLGVSVRPLTALQHHRLPGPRPGPGSTLQSHPVLRSRSTRYCLNFRKPAESSTNPRTVEGTSAATGKPVPPMLAPLGHPLTGARWHID